MIYITGDTHGDFRRIETFCQNHKTTKEDIMIILGDAGINYFGNERDSFFKYKLNDMPITFFCIHGNHEMRPESTGSYILKDFKGGKVWLEKAFPGILFAKDGEIFNIENKKILVIGGAYSVDKFYRLRNNLNWFSDEQPNDDIKAFTEKNISTNNNKVDIVLTHTCPLKYEPIECFLSCVDQSTVDKSTEMWLDKIEDNLTYDKWYCGHWHISKKIDKIQFMFDDYDVL